jgi:hypothetical protein
MNKVDEDISKATKQLRSFIAKAEDSKYQTPSEFIKNEGFDFFAYVNSRMERGSKFIMGDAFEKYGPGLAYHYNAWTSGMIVMILGVYTNEELKDSKMFTKNQLAGLEIRDFPKRKILVYLKYYPKHDSIQYQITTLTDGWSSMNMHKSYGYYLQTIFKFMNWDSNPLP